MADRETHLAHIESMYTDARSWWVFADGKADDVEALKDVCDFSFRYAIASCLKALCNLAEDLVDKNYPYANEFGIHYFLDNYTGGAAEEYELTMGKLISAMYTASNDEYKSFIGLVDAYRVALWNQPFDVEFYAAIARGFELWG